MSTKCCRECYTRPKLAELVGEKFACANQDCPCHEPKEPVKEVCGVDVQKEINTGMDEEPIFEPCPNPKPCKEHGGWDNGKHGDKPYATNKPYDWSTPLKGAGVEGWVESGARKNLQEFLKKYPHMVDDALDSAYVAGLDDAKRAKDAEREKAIMEARREELEWIAADMCGQPREVYFKRVLDRLAVLTKGDN